MVGFVFTKLLDASFWSYLTRSNDVFEALITFGLICATCILLFCTDRLVCPNKRVNTGLLVDLHLQNSHTILKEWGMEIAVL